VEEQLEQVRKERDEICKRESEVYRLRDELGSQVWHLESEHRKRGETLVKWQLERYLVDSDDDDEEEDE
jgi:hypothetical protein